MSSALLLLLLLLWHCNVESLSVFKKSVNVSDRLKFPVELSPFKFELAYMRSLEILHPKKTKIEPNFDSRKNWPKCPSISKIYDEGACTASWALAIASVLTDRFCISSKGGKFEFSAQELITCCKECTKEMGTCNGGRPAEAWLYAKKHGLPSGGPTGCKPYAPPVGENSVKCSGLCSSKKYPTTVYKLPYVVKQIQYEITGYGPVQAIISPVNDDFVYNYTDYIYECLPDFENKKQHEPKIVKIIGWGVEAVNSGTDEGTDYWLAANFMGEKWGQMGGFFKIAKGINTCGIEEFVMLGQVSETGNKPATETNKSEVSTLANCRSIFLFHFLHFVVIWIL